MNKFGEKKQHTYIKVSQEIHMLYSGVTNNGKQNCAAVILKDGALLVKAREFIYA
jgi:hypothetical protein